jgi:hypothetical protein
MKDQLLQLEMQLLVLRHGRRAVLQALAQLGNHTLEEVESEIWELEARKTTRKPKPVTADTVIAKAFSERPSDIPLVEALVRDYENKVFLPQLRDVQRFLDRIGGTRGRLKSRSTALPQLIKSLARMSSAELKDLRQDAGHSGKSDYELLAREIMGTSTMPLRPGDRS